MDFIIKLLKLKDLATKDAFNLILIIINKLTKYLHIIAFKEIYIAKQLGYIVLDRLIKYYKLLIKITNNKNKLFILNY